MSQPITYATLKRCKRLSDRLSARIQARIGQPGPKPDLDDLFSQHSKAHRLYMRLFWRYEAEKPQFLRDLWAD